MGTLISTTTGDPTARFGFRGTDLGYFILTRHGYVLSIFGDTFNGADPADNGGGWRSPVILRTHNSNLDDGVEWDNAVGGKRAKEAWPYRHVGQAGTINGTNFDALTIIPNDIIHLPDGNYLGNGFRVKKWGTFGDQTMCETISTAWFWSSEKHAEHWEPCRHANNLNKLYEWPNAGKGKWFQNTTMVMMDPDGKKDPHVYVFGTPAGRWKGAGAGIYLRRAHWQHMCNDTAWEYWGWTGSKWEWGKNVNPTPILSPTTKGTPIGEINAQVIDGVVVLAYVDGPAGTVTRTALAPDNVWTDPQVHITYPDAPAQYAPSVHPYSTLDAPFVHLSQWYNNLPTAGTFYGSRLWKLDPLRRPTTPTVNHVPSSTMAADLSGLDAADLAQVLTAGTTVDPAALARELETAGQ